MKKQPVWFGYLYLLKCGEFYKIGFSETPRKRVHSFRTGSPHPILLIHTLKTPHYKTVEKVLHRHFSEKRHQGEWFRLTDEDVAYIKSLNAIGRTPEEQRECEHLSEIYSRALTARCNAENRQEARDAISTVAAV